MKSNQKNNKSGINWSMTTIKNMMLYLITIILKHLKNRKSKEDLEEQGINLKTWTPRGMEIFVHKTLHIKKLCSFIKMKIG